MKIYLLIPVVLLGACNYMHVKPDTLEKGTLIYADRGGYSMKRALKENLEERGFQVTVGTLRSSSSVSGDGDEDISMSSSRLPANVKYAVIVRERRERFTPVWCVFNGFWWWNFNISIADQKTSEEILSWSGKGCANSSMRRLDKVLDELEK
ncbi:MAG: hypothetical protein FWE52_00710 [Alphaproteobacteria bacterium]|nr:hypothetical protein [Alphaproteobacteria bacterium]